VERDPHRAELEGEKMLPGVLRDMITRRVLDIRDFELPPNDGVSTIVLGKHLCGLGTDCSIEFIVRQRSDVVGCVFATCCLNKICVAFTSSKSSFSLATSRGSVRSPVVAGSALFSASLTFFSPPPTAAATPTMVFAIVL